MSESLEKLNENEMESPKWLNIAFFTEVLVQYEKVLKESLEIKSLKITPGSAEGDHYASIIFRAKIDYKANAVDKSKSLIIKTMPEVDGSNKWMDTLSETTIFETEIGMYTEVIPKMEQILRDAGDQTVLGANCIYYSLSPRKIIILEDLCTLDYAVLRGRALNIDEIKAAYTKLAKWHAVSYKIGIENPTFFDAYQKGSWTLPDIEKNPFFNAGINYFIEMLERTPSLTQFKPYFVKISVDFFERNKASYREYRDNRQANAYYVLSHGDYHLKNMMFKNNAVSGELEDCMLLDYQFCYFGPIVADIINSIYMMLHYEQRRTKLDELLYFYFTTFRKTLEAINFDGPLPKYVEFRNQLMAHKHLELYSIFNFLPLMYSIFDGSLDIVDYIENGGSKLYKNKNFIDEMEYLLPKFKHLGYFDDL